MKRMLKLIGFYAGLYSSIVAAGFYGSEIAANIATLFLLLQSMTWLMYGSLLLVDNSRTKEQTRNLLKTRNKISMQFSFALACGAALLIVALGWWWTAIPFMVGLFLYHGGVAYEADQLNKEQPDKIA